MDKTAGVIDGPSAVSEYGDDLLSEQLERFKGYDDPRAIVNDFIREEAERMEAKNRAMDAIACTDVQERAQEDVVRPINDYLSLIIEIGKAMCDEIHKQFDEEQVRVAQVRTKFDFRYWLVRMLFVIDADTEEELRISQLMNQLEKMVLLSAPYAAELDYVNKRDSRIDPDFLRRSYPFVAKVRASD